MGSSLVSPEDVLESLMNDGTVDAIRLKIINQLKTNEELRNNTITMVEESRVLSTPGAEKQTKRELFEALRAELETQALEMASKAVWELILDNNGLGKEINETVEEVFCRLSGCEAPPFPQQPPTPQHQQPMPLPLQPPQQPPPPTLLQQFSQQPQPPLPQLLQQLLQQQQHGPPPPPFQPLVQLQHPPLAPLPQLPLQHFPQQQPPLPPQLQHPPLAPLPQLPLQRLPQQQHLPPPLHQLPQQQHPPLPPQQQEQPPPPPPSPPPPQPPPPSPPSPMQQPPPSPPPRQLPPSPQQHLSLSTADVQIKSDKNSEEREEGEKVYDIEMTESSSQKRAFSELNMQGAALVGNGDTEFPTVVSSESEMP